MKKPGAHFLKFVCCNFVLAMGGIVCVCGGFLSTESKSGRWGDEKKGREREVERERRRRTCSAFES
jgi:hypothetical protein